MRPTTHDIAREAEVSLATVDRVLNNRTGVSAKTHERVNQAIKKLGYVRDVSAANLAKKRQYKMAFVLPEDKGLFQQSLRSAIEEASVRGFADRTQIQLVSVPPNEPHALVLKLKKLLKKKIDGVAIMAPATPQLRDAISELKNNGVAVVALVSDQPDSECDHFVGINNVAAGRTAAVLMGRFLPAAQGEVLVLTNSLQSHDSVDRRLGFDEVMNQRFQHLNVLPTLEGHGDSVRIEQALGNAIESSNNLVGIYSLSTGNRSLNRYLNELNTESNLVIITHELTSHTRTALNTGAIDAVITQNPGHIIRSALRVLRAKSDHLDIDTSQEKIRIEVVIKENLD